MAETALVTGATSGIGESLCLLFASDGYNLVTVARDEKALQKQAKELRILGVDVEPVACDLSQEGAARKLFEEVRSRGCDVDILVNDAGYSVAGSFAELSVKDIRAMLQLSVVNLSELTSVFLHPMLERGHGRILNMSSMMAKTPCPYNALYSAAKVFVLSFTAALSAELKGTGVTATAAVPGATRTNFPTNAGIEDAPAWKYFAMDADETAIRVYRALMQGRCCSVTGWYNKVGAQCTRFMPLSLQLVVGEWLIGTRKHPLSSEGNAHKGDAQGTQDRNSASENAKHHSGERQSQGEAKPNTGDPCGGGRGYRVSTLGCKLHKQKKHHDQAQEQHHDQTQEQHRSQKHGGQNADSKGAGNGHLGWRQQGTAQGGEDAGNVRHGPGHFAGPRRDGVPSDLGEFARHGRFSR